MRTNLESDSILTATVGIASPVVGVITSFQEQIERTLRVASLIVGLMVGAMSLIAMVKKMRGKCVGVVCSVVWAPGANHSQGPDCASDFSQVALRNTSSNANGLSDSQYSKTFPPRRPRSSTELCSKGVWGEAATD